MKIGGIVHVLKALEPRLGEVVIVGGWAWYLYRKYLTGSAGLPGEFTLDVDVALPRPLPHGRGLDRLLEDAAFEEDMTGENTPPVTRYAWPSRKSPEAVVDFLTPARGAGIEATLRTGGVVAQQLRTLDVLLEAPLVLSIDERSETETFVGAVRVPRLGAFLLQKVQTLSSRRATKRDKDLFYIFDLADETRGLGEMIKTDAEQIRLKLGAPSLEAAAALLRREGGQATSSAVAKVMEQIPQEERPSREYVAETFNRLAVIFEG
jgi:hypothetical protein